MNRLLMIFAAILVAGALAAPAGSQAPGSAPAPKPGSQAQPQSPSQAQPQTPPATQGAQAPAPTPAHKQPQAKTQDEFTAFQTTVQKTNPSEAEQAAREFEVKYPNSELLSLLFQQVMTKYQQADNAEKTVEMGRKATQYDPDNTVALVLTGTVLAERTRESDIDRDERLNEAVKDVQHALKLIEENKFVISPNATPRQVQEFKDQVTFMAYAAMGQAELVKKNDAPAENYFRKAVLIQQGSLDALTWLRLSLALDHQNKYADALNAANKAVELSGSNAAVGNLAKIEQSRLRQLTEGGSKPPTQTNAAPGKPEPQQVPH